MGYASSIFLSGFAVLLIFNAVYVMINPNAIFVMTMGIITGLVTTVIALGVISGFQLLGSGFNSRATGIIFGVASLLNILFSIQIGNNTAPTQEQLNMMGWENAVMYQKAFRTNTNGSIQLGLGLINNVGNVFYNQTEIFGLGFFLMTILSVMMLVSGIMVVVQSGGGDS